MRRGPLLAIAVSVAAAAPLLVVLSSASNRAGEPEAEVELTDRELRLVPLGEGRRWAALRLDWNRELQEDRKEPGWLDAAKLAALGFDTRLPEDDPEAPGFYAWQPAREVFLALQHDGPAAAAVDAAVPEGSATRSRLHPVDADLDARALRARHPDRRRVLVVPAVVAAECHGYWDPTARTLSAPFLRGTIRRLLVTEVQVPRGKRGLLDALASGEARPAGAGATSGKATDAAGTPPPAPPRYRVVLQTGRRLQPRVLEVRPPGP